MEKLLMTMRNEARWWNIRAEELWYRRLCSALLLAAAIAPPAAADVNFYRAGKSIVHFQTSDAQPAGPTEFYGGADFQAADGDNESARVFSTSTVTPSPLSPIVLTEFFPGYWGASQGYASLAEMDADLPPGDVFGFLLEGGTLGDRLGLLPLPATNLFSADIPFFTGNAFSELNGMDSTMPFTLTWNGYTPAAGINSSPIFFNIFRLSDGHSVAGTVVSHNVTSFLVPANALEPMTQYRAEIDYSSRLDTPNAGFTSAFGTALFDSITRLEFTTGPTEVTMLPGDYNVSGSVDAADYAVWRDSYGSTTSLAADGNLNNVIDDGDYGVWKTNFGNENLGSGRGGSVVPEPVMWPIAFLALAAMFRRP